MKGLFTALILTALTAVNAFAVTLPEGTVAGLPQNLIVMDENGNSPENGELYIYIDNMIPNEVYTKDITVMNGRDDAQYAIYMTAEPNYSKGNVDLLAETVCRLYLDGALIYEGRVDGSGSPNMQSEALDLGGVLASGESRNLRAEFQWVTDMNWSYDEEYGNAYYGEVSFIWTFYASIPTETTTESGGSGGGTTPEKTTTSSSSGGGSGSSYTPEGNVDTSPPKELTEPPAHDYEGIIDEGSGTEITEETVSEAATEGAVERATHWVLKRIPIPDDVKTGYFSEIVFYVKLAVCAFGAAAVILAVIIYKRLRLRALEKREGASQKE